MKKIVYAFLMMLFSSPVFSMETGSPFMLASNYGFYIKLAQNTNDFSVIDFSSMNEVNPYEKSQEEKASKVMVDSDEKWNVIKDFEDKPKSLSGEVSFGASERVKIDAFAGYTFPEKNLSEESEDLKRREDAYSLKINVEVAI